MAGQDHGAPQDPARLKRDARHARAKAAWAAGPPRCLMIGDSLLRAWVGPYPSPFDGRTINLGLSGARVGEMVERLQDHQGADWSRLRIAVIMGGTNDLTDGSPPDRIVTGLRRLVEIVRAEAPGAVVMVCPIPPRGPHRRYSAEAHDLANVRVRSMVDELAVLTCDLSEMDDPALRIDSVHLTPEGYEALRRAIDKGFGVAPY
jgi:lysophospholipase L1-like esterase